jgi:hypothetical protein
MNENPLGASPGGFVFESPFDIARPERAVASRRVQGTRVTSYGSRSPYDALLVVSPKDRLKRLKKATIEPTESCSSPRCRLM